MICSRSGNSNSIAIFSALINKTPKMVPSQNSLYYILIKHYN